MRRYAIERDKFGTPIRLTWLSDDGQGVGSKEIDLEEVLAENDKLRETLRHTDEALYAAGHRMEEDARRIEELGEELGAVRRIIAHTIPLDDDVDPGNSPALARRLVERSADLRHELLNLRARLSRCVDLWELPEIRGRRVISLRGESWLGWVATYWPEAGSAVFEDRQPSTAVARTPQAAVDALVAKLKREDSQKERRQ